MVYVIAIKLALGDHYNNIKKIEGRKKNSFTSIKENKLYFQEVSLAFT